MCRNICFVCAAFFSVLALSCSQKQSVDLLVVNARVYTVDEGFSTAEALAIQDGKILEVGASDDLSGKYTAPEALDIQGKAVLPGWIDAHAHFYGLGQYLQTANLTGAESFDGVLERVAAFQAEKQKSFITGRGWDQNLWEDKRFPSREKLDSLFPDTPIALTRTDGHAMLANKAALDLAGITADTPQPPGGEILLQDGTPSGLLIDNAMELVRTVIPKPGRDETIQALIDAQDICFSYGLTTINDAGLDRDIIELIDSLQQAGSLKIRIYAMLSHSPKNLAYYLPNGPYKTDRLHVRSVKVYGDGALGSRGAALKEPYADRPGHYGALVTEPEEIERLAKRLAGTDFQMNTHAIGDSANGYVLSVYREVLKNAEDRRWKIEHAQVVSPEDRAFFDGSNIAPSVQPTHATGDMYWAEDRIGPERMAGAYAYKSLLDRSGVIALGTDFPVEGVSPFHTFYAAVARKDLQGFPEGGFRPEEALSREEALKGMTRWAAWSNFEENEKGSIEAGKQADFIILDRDIMTVPEDSIPSTKVEATFVGGERVY